MPAMRFQSAPEADCASESAEMRTMRERAAMPGRGVSPVVLRQPR